MALVARGRIEAAAARLQGLTASLRHAAPSPARAAERVEAVAAGMGNILTARLAAERANLDRTDAQIAALNPATTLARGYAIVERLGASPPRRPPREGCEGRQPHRRLRWRRGLLGGGQLMAEQPFEDLVAKLEEHARKLEEGNIPLEEAMTTYEEGAALVQQLRKLLDEAELRVQRLQGDLEEGASLPRGRRALRRVRRHR